MKEFALLFLALPLAASATTYPVKDAKTAIAIAKKVCRGKANPSAA
jgi:hypothetical protein